VDACSVGGEGLEPPVFSLGGSCSIH